MNSQYLVMMMHTEHAIVDEKLGGCFAGFTRQGKRFKLSMFQNQTHNLSTKAEFLLEFPSSAFQLWDLTKLEDILTSTASLTPVPSPTPSSLHRFSLTTSRAS